MNLCRPGYIGGGKPEDVIQIGRADVHVREDGIYSIRIVMVRHGFPAWLAAGTELNALKEAFDQRAPDFNTAHPHRQRPVLRRRLMGR